ncbi:MULTISPECIES: AfsR/SARP family transcriptional regulator [Micromonospora]|uniref:Transcriptional regulatory protein, C terminal n=1 Tax=Micromonospora yangpuensis TaxID=683228 RepID=A0A1C6U9Q4_9ACTN|nr:BTAD domain-containing putative transcriptional regulator [Micromonospora yangpuensis]SCL50825.1 Transcriptional regulatory protein, C terminal [Micromonospora yangpuensis]
MSYHAESSTAELFGGFQITIHGNPVTNWRAGRSRALVQYLLLHVGRPVSRDTLREALWPHLPPSAGTTSVKAAVHGARRALGGPAGRPTPVQICSVDGGYLLRADELRIDVTTFGRWIANAEAAVAAGNHAAAAEHFHRAVAVYQGPLLPTQDAQWVVTEREWCRTRALQALRYLSDLALTTGDWWTAIHWNRRAIDVDPYDPVAFAVLTDCHHRLGLTSQALRWDDLARGRLAEV